MRSPLVTHDTFPVIPALCAKQNLCLDFTYALKGSSYCPTSASVHLRSGLTFGSGPFTVSLAIAAAFAYRCYDLRQVHRRDLNPMVSCSARHTEPRTGVRGCLLPR